MKKITVATTLILASNFAAAIPYPGPWTSVMSCEQNAVRFESRRIGPYQEEFQLVVSTRLAGFQKLRRDGAINANTLNDAQELVLRNVKSRHGHWSYRASVPRDQGNLVYTIVPSYENKKLLIDAGWTDGSVHGSIPSFSSVEFYGCSF